jgi:hypothetical protein
MRTILSLMIWTVMSLALAATAHAVSVRVIEGNVFLGGGNGYDLVLGTAEGKVGDSVMAGEYGVAQIVYSSSCVVTVKPGTVVTVEAGLPEQCSGADSDWSTDTEPASEGLSAGQILLGAGIAGGIGVGIYAATSGADSDKGASP